MAAGAPDVLRGAVAASSSSRATTTAAISAAERVAHAAEHPSRAIVAGSWRSCCSSSSGAIVQRRLSTSASAFALRRSRVPRHDTLAANRTSIVFAEPGADAFVVEPMRARQDSNRLAERDGVHANAAIC
jgi:hypothetical protein